MSEQDDGKVTTLQRPTINDPKAWREYWRAVQPKEWFEAWGYWRAEPEIDAVRQKYLAERRAIVPNIEQGIYPFGGIRLSRADVEWLLATHENGRGPVDWNDESQRKRNGLDIRGTDLHSINLSGLPLACLCGSLTLDEWYMATKEQYNLARVHLEKAYLREAHLEGANLHGVHLEGADLQGAHLEESYLGWADLGRCILRTAHLQGTDLWGVYFDASTNLDKVILGDKRHGFALIDNIHWGGVNLSVVDWSQVIAFGEERIVTKKQVDKGNRPVGLQQVIRTYRGLAVILQSQGLNEEAAHFAYRAQQLQRVVLRLQKKLGQYLFSLLLDLLAGYGYRPGRSVLWYLAIIVSFALAYHFLGGLSLFPPDAFVFSIMSFHGRGFFPSLSSETNLHNPLVMLAAIEAIVGLLIEISFIATFTQRFFGK